MAALHTPVRFGCRCGVIGEVPYEVASTATVIRCHCQRCRRFHTSSFATLLHVPLGSAICERLMQSGKIFEDECRGCGDSVIERIFCRTCRSGLGMRHGEGLLLGLGCVDDSSLDAALAQRWQTTWRDQCFEQRSPWWSARPANPSRRPTAPRLLRGGCLCGRCQFEAASGSEFQLQHCYCSVCRQLSGSVAQSWVPVRPDGFRWTRHETLELVRTTSHGQRHECSHCGGVLTIVYDSQPDCIWPVAGAIDDASYPPTPGALSASLCRVIHICCTDLQPWYVLPEDSLPRLKYAG